MGAEGAVAQPGIANLVLGLILVLKCAYDVYMYKHEKGILRSLCADVTHIFFVRPSPEQSLFTVLSI